MDRFRLEAPYSPAGDQPEAIEALTQGLQQGQRFQVLLGVTGSGKTFTMANVIQQVQRPTLVLSHNKTLVSQLYGEFKQFFPHNAVEYFVSYYDYYQPEAYLPATDTYIEKDISINERIERLRLRTTSALLSGRRDVLVVASVSCIYGLGNPAMFRSLRVEVEVGKFISPNEVMHQLVRAMYSRSRTSLEPGTFRGAGDAMEVFSMYSEWPVRIVWSNDGYIQEIYLLHPETLKKIEPLQRYIFFPNSIFTVTEDVMEQALREIARDLDERVKELEQEGKFKEAERLQLRIREDIDMMREVGYCSGIENYSRYFDRRRPGQRPFCLLDYFPDNFLLIVDESHVTLPQVRGMYEGDRARKKILVEYGFRLPSALDNRPLNFEEFLALIPQAIFVSATPGDFEVRLAGGAVVEQIVRPTGLLEPSIEVRPTLNQIDDLIDEIHQTVRKGGRVLVTTLTKRMAEELSRYLSDVGIQTRYLHSDIDTLERVEILRNLRLGEFDVLVGVNLMREGLDLPEVALVVILDADKEGFLRSETALTQIAGRAARHLEGRVILYADEITYSMQQMMEETNRRRQKQIAYNLRHGIRPQPIRANRQTILQQTAVVDQVESVPPTSGFRSPTTGVDKKAQIQAMANDLRKNMPVDQACAEAQKRMKEAAARFDFGQAAFWRDVMFALQKT